MGHRDAEVLLSSRLPADDDAPRAARALMERLDAIDSLDMQRRADLDVAVSELVTNAVVHGPHGHVDLQVSLTGITMRIEVADAGAEAFEFAADHDHGSGGWGLRLVESFTDRWGIDRRPHTVAWCELDLA